MEIINRVQVYRDGEDEWIWNITKDGRFSTRSAYRQLSDMQDELKPEDVFWALRVGGEGSFGIILAWQVLLQYAAKIFAPF
ncbi:hypothetical protein Ancab_021494 [Ancistrocladus abbreviatus]